MVRHIVLPVKKKKRKNTKFLEFPAGDCQNTRKFDRFRPFSRPSAEVNWPDHFRLRQPAQSPAWERAGPAQIPGTANRQDSLQKLSPPTGRGATRANINRSFNDIRRKSERSSYSAVRAGTWHLPPVEPRSHTRSHLPDLRPQFSLRSRVA